MENNFLLLFYLFEVYIFCIVIIIAGVLAALFGLFGDHSLSGFPLAGLLWSCAPVKVSAAFCLLWHKRITEHPDDQVKNEKYYEIL